MSNIQHPSFLMEPGWVALIRSSAAEAEHLGMLRPQQLSLIYEQQWFKLLVPRVYGGLEKSLPEILRVEEALSWADGSLGWTVTLCGGAGWFGGFIAPEEAGQILMNKRLCIAGSGAATGTAMVTENGYRVTGTWHYASGARHATHFTANCAVLNGDEAVLNSAGNALVLPFIFDKKDVRLIPAWKYMGMVATGSYAYAVTNLEVGPDRCFNFEAGKAVVNTPLYQYPFLQLAETTLAVNLSGMAVHFLDLCTSIFGQKKTGDRLTGAQKIIIQQKLEQAAAAILTARVNFYSAVEVSLADQSEHALKQVSAASRVLVHTARMMVDELYPYCVLKAASPDEEINRVWRDIHTASQHALLTFEAGW
ncbi:flavin-dependent monooxygenase [soil metagenome]